MKDMYEQILPKLESRVLSLSSQICEQREGDEEFKETEITTEVEIKITQDGETRTFAYNTSSLHRLNIHISDDEVKEWIQALEKDTYFGKIFENIRKEEDALRPRYPQFSISDRGLMHFSDAQGNSRLCVPKSKTIEIMSDDHNKLSEGAHEGYHRMFNRLSCVYFWPKMMGDVRSYVTTCDICQKVKTRKHAPYGMLRNIPIPSRPFEVVSMDFIPHLPKTDTGYDNLLVITCKLTKYAIFIATQITITDQGTARLFHLHVLTRFGIPLQVICDRDSRWANYFWKELCEQIGMQRALTTSYHPQADGQTEILNQTLETALRTFVNRSRNNWDEILPNFSLSYNNTPHSSTGYAPAYLLFGYIPTTGSNLWKEGDVREVEHEAEHEAEGVPKSEVPFPTVLYDEIANDMINQSEAHRTHAKDCLVFAQVRQERNYNSSHIPIEFEVGDEVLINPQSLELLKKITGVGRKLLPKFDGPFEITEKLSPVTYRLNLSSNYEIHPVLNIEHLEKYHRSPEELGERPTRQNIRDVDKAPKEEFAIDAIVDERWIKRRKKRIHEYRVKWKGYDSSHNSWKTPRDINAPRLIKKWKEDQYQKKEEAKARLKNKT
jgi:hypothetical protein